MTVSTPTLVLNQNLMVSHTQYTDQGNFYLKRYDIAQTTMINDVITSVASQPSSRWLLELMSMTCVSNYQNQEFWWKTKHS